MQSNGTSRRTLLQAGLGLAATVPATARAQTGPARGGDPLRIGVMTDLSGPFAGAGSVPLFQGAEVAIAEVIHIIFRCASNRPESGTAWAEE